MKKLFITSLVTLFTFGAFAQMGGTGTTSTTGGTSTGVGTGTTSGSTTENPSMRDEDTTNSDAGVGSNTTKPRRSKDWKANRNGTQDETTPSSRSGRGTNNGTTTESNPSSGM